MSGETFMSKYTRVCRRVTNSQEPIQGNRKDGKIDV